MHSTVSIARTTRLLARPSFLSGFARSLDLGGLFDSYNQSSKAATADRKALASDWRAVGADLRHAMKSVKKS